MRTVTDKQIELYDLCLKFIRDNEITCQGTVFQTDKVSENALVFIDQICFIVGYHEEEEE